MNIRMTYLYITLSRDDSDSY